MKAIVRDTYDTLDILEFRDIDKPEIADDEVLVRVHAAGVGREAWGPLPCRSPRRSART
jgi:NADPH:quinone reductase-like Zn-dependent oxidoreductase